MTLTTMTKSMSYLPLQAWALYTGIKMRGSVWPDPRNQQKTLSRLLCDIAYQVRDIIDTMQTDAKTSSSPQKLTAVLLMNNLMQFQADILKMEILRVPKNLETTISGGLPRDCQ